MRGSYAPSGKHPRAGLAAPLLSASTLASSHYDVILYEADKPGLSKRVGLGWPEIAALIHYLPRSLMVAGDFLVSAPPKIA